MNEDTQKQTEMERPRRRKSGSSQFIPNVTQFNEALESLPDPEVWSEDSYECRIAVGDSKRSIWFNRRRINRGNERPYRWIYNGKILVRKRDI